MNEKTLAKVNRFGKVGKAVVTVLAVLAVAAAVLVGIAAVYTATLPKDAVTVSVTSRAEFKIDEGSFSNVWNFLVGGVSYATDENPTSALLQNGTESEIRPPEDTQIYTDLRFFNQSYSSAEIHSEESEKTVEAESSPSEYRSSDLVTLLAFGTLVAASVAVALFMLRGLFKVLSVCESPFCADFVSKLRTFGYALLPVAVFASIGETLAVRFLSAGRNTGISVQWGILLAFVVTMCLVSVFRYGVQLQKESDETL